MKKLLLIPFLLIQYTLWAQKNVKPTDTLMITGKVNTPVYFTLADLAKFPSVDIPDLTITDHTGAVKKTVKGLRGFTVKQLLEKAVLKADSPKLLSEFYFIFTGSDGYKVVYSWNELFNTETGNNVYIVTAKEGSSIEQMEERILAVSPKDFKTGRRYVKGLAAIVVGRVE